MASTPHHKTVTISEDAVERHEPASDDQEAKSNAEKPRAVSQRSRQYSEPSDAFDRPRSDSSHAHHRSSQKDVRRPRQDSVCSTGFGSSHFGSVTGKRRESELMRRESLSGSQRTNYVVESASIVPTMSIEHLPDLNDPANRDDDDDEEMNNLNRNGDVTKEGDFEKSMGLLQDADDKGHETKTPVQPEKLSSEEEEAFKKRERRRYMKNLLVLCLGFFFIFAAFLSLRNLQSSLNAKDGLGLYALSATYALFFIGCIMATTVVQRLGPKRAIVLATSGLFLYVIANFYPLFYTLIPAAAAAGFCQGVIWTAHATYIANIAASYTELTSEKIQTVLSRFNGIFFVFYQFCQIIGGMISSIILKAPKDDFELFNGTAYNESLFDNGTYYIAFQNMTRVRSYAHCGKEYCPYLKGIKGAAPVDRHLVFILVGVFTALAITGILILTFLLDPLEGHMSAKKSQAVGKQLLAVFKFYYHRYAICMVGIMFYSLLQAAFIFGEYNKAYVTCTLGIHMVGFIMMTNASASAVAAYFNGRIQKYTGRPPLLLVAFLFHFGVFMVLLAWKPSPSDTVVFFILVVFWGVGDGIIMTQDISLIGFLFSHNKEPAFAALKMTQSLANFTFFMAGSYLCTWQKIAFVLSVLIIAAAGYFALELILLCEERKKKAKAPLAGTDEVKQPIKA